MGTTRLRFAAALAIPLFASNCSLISGGCNYETRAVQAEGSVTENGAEIARGLMNAGATRGSSNSRFLSYDITSSLIYVHIQSVGFVDANQPGVVLFDFPFIEGVPPATIRSVINQLDDAPTPNLGGTFEIVAGNRAVLEVRTDLPERPVVHIPFTVTMHEDWVRPNCS